METLEQIQERILTTDYSRFNRINKIDRFRGEYYFLSNMFERKIQYDGIWYTGSETAFQLSKNFTDAGRNYYGMRLTPHQAKGFGKGAAPSNWKQISVGVMYSVNVVKFKDLELRQKLLDTGNRYLEEGNWWKDDFWGVYSGRGVNALGKVLMTIREEIKQGLI